MFERRRLGTETRAAAWMTGAVFMWSWVPLAVAIVGTSVGPFMFIVWAIPTWVLVWLVYLILKHPHMVSRKDVWARGVEQLRTRNGVLAALVPFELLCFVFASQFMDTALVTILVSGYPILFVLWRRGHDRKHVNQRYSSVRGLYI